VWLAWVSMYNLVFFNPSILEIYKTTRAIHNTFVMSGEQECDVVFPVKYLHDVQ